MPKLEQEEFWRGIKEEVVCLWNYLFLEDVSTSGAHVYAGDHGIPQRPCAFLLLLLVSELGG